MALKLTVLVFVILTIIPPTSASYDDELKSPLDINFVLNDLNKLLQEPGGPQLPSGGYSANSQPSSGGTGDYSYPKSPGTASRKPEEVDLSQYSNNAGDAQYKTNQQLGVYRPPQKNYPLFGGSGQDSSFGGTVLQQPRNSRVDGSSQDSGSLSSFGQSLPGSHYPIEIPGSSPDAGAQYSGDVANTYVPQKRQILPDPYSGQNVPYSARQNPNEGQNQGGNYNIRGQQPYQTNGGGTKTTRNDVYGTGFSEGSGVQSPQGSDYQPGQDLSGILFQNKPPAVASPGPPHVLDNHPQNPYNNGVAVPGNQGYHPGDAGYVGGGSVVGTYVPQASGGVGASGGGVAGSGGGQYVVVPQHTYPTDVRGYRDQLQCWPQFFLQYDHDFSGAVWQDVKGHVRVQQGRAVFEGQGFLAIPFFACNDLLPRYSMIFVISPAFSGRGGPQAVLGNSVFSSQASLLVSLTDNTLTLVIRQRAPHLTPKQLLAQCHQHPHHHHHRRRRSVGSGGGYYDAGPSTGVSGPGFQSRPPYGSAADAAPHYSSQNQQDIVVLQLTISGEVMVTIAQENDWIFFSAGDQKAYKAGRLPTLTNEALYVGAGADPRGGGPLEHYTGTFDSFLFEKCP